MSAMTTMGTLPPVDRIGGVVPITRRDHPQVPVANDGSRGRHSPPGKGSRDDGPVTPAEPALPEGTPDVPSVSPDSTFGRVVNTFAGPHCSTSSALML